jgi:ABC-type uncharacterized transport system auxiliary subunit
MKQIPSGKRKLRLKVSMIYRCSLGLWAAAFLLIGCAAGGKSSVAIRQYALEYSPPAFTGMEGVKDSISVEPFSIARSYNTTSMVYRTQPYLYGDDAYHRWKVKPSVMLSDLLLRDMRNASLFGGVFSHGDLEDGCYALGGVIEELYELDEPEGSRAVLALNVTLLNASRHDPNGRTVFQRGYRSVQVLEARDAESLARAMSKAMETLSKEIILDTYRAIRKNGVAEKKESPLRGLVSK